MNWNTQRLPRGRRRPSRRDLAKYSLTPRLWNALRIVIVGGKFGVPQYQFVSLLIDLFGVREREAIGVIDDLEVLGCIERGEICNDGAWCSGYSFDMRAEHRIRFVPEESDKPWGPPRVTREAVPA